MAIEHVYYIVRRKNGLRAFHEKELNPHRCFHVVSRDEGWAIERESSGRTLDVFGTKHEAVEHARELARAKAGQLVTYKQDGEIQSEQVFA